VSETTPAAGERTNEKGREMQSTFRDLETRDSGTNSRGNVRGTPGPSLPFLTGTGAPFTREPDALAHTQNRPEQVRSPSPRHNPTCPGGRPDRDGGPQVKSQAQVKSKNETSTM